MSVVPVYALPAGGSFVEIISVAAPIILGLICIFFPRQMSKIIRPSMAGGGSWKTLSSRFSEKIAVRLTRGFGFVFVIFGGSSFFPELVYASLILAVIIILLIVFYKIKEAKNV